MWSPRRYSLHARPPVKKDLVSLSFLSLGQIALRFGLEFVQTISRAKVKFTAILALCIALTAFDRHPTYRVLRRSHLLAASAVSCVLSVGMTTVATVNHMRSTPEAHHQIEETGVEQ